MSAVCLEDMTLTSMSKLKQWPEATWHPETRPGLESWLSTSRAKGTKERLECIGNIVIPEMAYLALNLMGHGVSNA